MKRIVQVALLIGMAAGGMLALRLLAPELSVPVRAGAFRLAHQCQVNTADQHGQPARQEECGGSHQRECRRAPQPAASLAGAGGSPTGHCGGALADDLRLRQR